MIWSQDPKFGFNLERVIPFGIVRCCTGCCLGLCTRQTQKEKKKKSEERGQEKETKYVCMKDTDTYSAWYLLFSNQSEWNMDRALARMMYQILQEQEREKKSKERGQEKGTKYVCMKDTGTYSAWYLLFSNQSEWNMDRALARMMYQII